MVALQGKYQLFRVEFSSFTDHIQNYQEALDYPLEEILRDHAFFVEPTGSDAFGESDALSLKNRVSELESEVQSLRDQLCRAKGVNDSVWDIVVQRLIKQPEPKEKSTDDSAEEPKKKRARA